MAVAVVDLAIVIPYFQEIIIISILEAASQSLRLMFVNVGSSDTWANELKAMYQSWSPV